MAETPKLRFESRMLIDGKPVDGEAGRFTNINPATEDVLGEVADASRADMHRAIDAARRAFDKTDWSTNHTFRKRCLEQLQAALEAEKEAIREELGGYKASGVGRQNGLAGFDQYTELKSVAYPAT